MHLDVIDCYMTMHIVLRKHFFKKTNASETDASEINKKTSFKDFQEYNTKVY